MEAEYPFHTAFLLLFLAVVAIRMYSAGYADGASGVRQTTQGEGAFRALRVIIGVPSFFGFLGYMVWPPIMAWSQLPLPPQARWSGVAAFALGLLLLAWVQKHLSRNFTGTVQIRPGGNVVTTGPYAYVRHPMYLSFLLLALGTFLLTANWFLGGGFLALLLMVLIVRLPVEERALKQAYGPAYVDYKARTGALFPHLR